jgi:hypothetical protein
MPNESNNESEKSALDLITVAGGVEVEVSYLDNLETELVKVRQIPISKISEFLLAMGDEARAIEIYCDKPKGWADTLTLESANLIADKGQEINLPFFHAWWRRQAKWRRMQSVWSEGATDVGSTKKSPAGSRSDNLRPQSPITTT